MKMNNIPDLKILKNNIPMPNRGIFEGDNLKVMDLIESETIDLIYLDPPFCSNTDYSFQGQGFKDTWKSPDDRNFDLIKLMGNGPYLLNFIGMSKFSHSDEMQNYLIYLCVRLIEMHRILKLSGSLALHCDDNASHYLKICLDLIFGKGNFRNDISLLYKNGSKNSKKHFPRNKDNILLYSKDMSQVKFDNTTGQVSKKTARNIEKGWKITWNSRSGKWHETYYRPYKTFTEKEVEELNSDRQKKIEQKPAEIHIRHATNGKEIKYLDWWDDMTIIPQSDKNVNDPKSESTGWPTQKNVEIPERIIECCTEPGDIVFDPFCGSGTTLVAAEKLKRNWIGSDISEDATNISHKRIDSFLGLFKEIIYRQRIVE